MKIKVLNHPDLYAVPAYQTDGSSGSDIMSNSYNIIPPGGVCLISTGLHLSIPYGYEGQVRSRSGLALNHNVVVLNSPGTIDSDYTGEIKVILFNHGKEHFKVKVGDRIAQIVFQKIVPKSSVKFVPVDSLGDTDREAGGFGSTGIS